MTQNVRINSRAEERSDELLDDSDKSFIVTEGFEWDLQAVFVELTTTAIVGNRRITVEIQDGSGNVFAQVPAGIVQAASLTRNYTFAQNIPDQTAFVGINLKTAFPALRLAPGEVIRVYDIAAIDTPADDMVVRLMIKTNRI